MIEQLAKKGILDGTHQSLELFGHLLRISGGGDDEIGQIDLIAVTSWTESTFNCGLSR